MIVQIDEGKHTEYFYKRLYHDRNNDKKDVKKHIELTYVTIIVIIIT